MWILEQFKVNGEDFQVLAFLTLDISNSSAWDSTMYGLIGRWNIALKENRMAQLNKSIFFCSLSRWNGKRLRFYCLIA